MKHTLIISFFRTLTLDMLDKSLYSLSRQTVSSDEVIFFDNNSPYSPSQIQEVLDRYFGCGTIQVYFAKHRDPSRTLSWAANRAIQLATNEVFIYTRADFVYDYSFCEKVLVAYDDTPSNYSTAWMYGMNYLADPVPDLKQFNWRENPQNLLKNSVGARPLRASHVDGPTFCTSKTMMHCAGWYDETITSWGYDQTSLGADMVRVGAMMRVVPEFLAFHMEHDVFPDLRDQAKALEVWKQSPRRVHDKAASSPRILLAKALASGMLDLPRAVTLSHLLLQTRNVPGDVVEFGCHEGHTAKLMRSLMSAEKQLFLYDSFDGLPEPGEFDGKAPQYQRCAMKAHQDFVVNNFLTDSLTVPIIVPGWFKDIKPFQLPEQISFAHLDGDLYESIRDSLALVYGRMARGAICVIDDYGNPDLPGVKKAVDEFENVRVDPVAHQAWFVKCPL